MNNIVSIYLFIYLLPANLQLSECSAACSLRCLYLRGDARNSMRGVSNACAVYACSSSWHSAFTFFVAWSIEVSMCWIIISSLAFSSGTVQECGDNPSLSSTRSSCHRCPRTGVCTLHVVHTVLHGVEAPSHSLQYTLCAGLCITLFWILRHSFVSVTCQVWYL